MLENGGHYRWRYCDESEDAAVHARLARDLALHPLVGRLLYQRGLRDPEVAASFLSPKLSDLHDPALLPGAVEAAQRIEQAVDQEQPIVIYGDYDVDGITASAILWHTLKAAGANVCCYVPHRIDEGYGLNVAAIKQISSGEGLLRSRCSGFANRPSADTSLGRFDRKPLIVSVDCGITAVEPAQAAREAGVDLIITDHHELPQGPLPAALITVHPRLAGSRYPYGYLCGAGVAFKLAWQFAKVHCGSERVSTAFRELLLDLLSLVALGTVADVVPLVDENRTLASFGLGQIKRTRIAGLSALIDATGLNDEKIDAFHVGFVLGPRLNACGRMGHAAEAVNLLTDADSAESARIAEHLTRENEHRRATERRMLGQAKQMVHEQHYNHQDCPAIVLCQRDWHPGVVGIVASRLVDEFARPVVMLCAANGQASGSARSVEGVAIHDAIGSCADLLNSFGGHAMAAGLRLDVDKIDLFRHRFTQYIKGVLSADDMVHTIDVSAVCSLDQITLELVSQIERMAPFGRGNPSPLLCLRGVQVEGHAQRVGSEGQHLRLAIRQGRNAQRAIGFGLGDFSDSLAPGLTLDLLFELKTSTWQGRRQVDLCVKDLKKSKD